VHVWCQITAEVEELVEAGTLDLIKFISWNIRARIFKVQNMKKNRATYSKNIDNEKNEY
jgi:hypothetical protein